MSFLSKLNVIMTVMNGALTLCISERQCFCSSSSNCVISDVVLNRREISEIFPALQDKTTVIKMLLIKTNHSAIIQRCDFWLSKNKLTLQIA